MQIENVQVKKERNLDEGGVDHYADSPKDILTTEPYQKRLSLMEQWWFETRRDHAENRAEMDLDEQFRDHHQWSEEDAEALRERGQKATQFNVILPVCLWLSGTEKRTRTDGKVLPRDDSEDEAETAEAKTKLLKYVSDVNREPWEKSDAFFDAASVGVGWIESGVSSDSSEEPIYTRHESWRNVWWDALCKRRDTARFGRYVFRAKWVDVEYLLAIWPERRAEIEGAAELADIYREDDEDGALSSGHSSFHQPQFSEFERRRVRVVECWHRFPCKCKVMHGEGPLDGKTYRKGDQVHDWAAESGHVTLHDAVKDKVFVGLFVGGDDQAQTGMLLEYAPSPYDHERFPLVPIWGYRDGKTGLPFGVVRGLRDIQEDMNKRWSKSLYLLSTNRVFYESDAFDDEQLALTEIDRPDGKIPLRSGGMNKVKTDHQSVLASSHLQMMDMGRAYVNEASGVTGENQGHETNATSGKAILARQSQGMTISTALFDNLRFAMQSLNELKLMLMEQYYDQPKKIRILGERNKTEWLPLNDSGKNMITEHAGDFVLDEQDFHASMRQAMFESLLEMVGKLPPEVGLKMLDLVIEMSDLPNKDEMVKRVRQMTGVDDPDMEEDEEAMAAKQEQQQKEKEIQDRATAAELQDKEAGAAKKAADAVLTQIKAEVAQVEARNKTMEALDERLGSKLEAFQKALSVAEQLQANPALGPAADDVVDDATPTDQGA